MIPALGLEDFLPPGIHIATLDEFYARFAYTIWRKELFHHLVNLTNDLKKIGCTAIYIDGSYTTKKRLPKDIDVCWEDQGLNYDEVEKNLPVLFELDFPRVTQQAAYKADIFPAHLYEASSGMMFIDFFQKDKATGKLKGIIKINIL